MITRGQAGSIFEEALVLPQDEEEDKTARLDVRVRNLTQKNCLVLDKLGGGKQSPAPSTSLSTSSRRSAAAAAVLPAHDPRSGSETERESTFSRVSGSSHALLLADPLHESPATHRTRMPSEPGLRKGTTRSSGSGSGSSAGRQHKGASLAGNDTARVREERTRRRTSLDSKKRAALPAEFRRASPEPEHHAPSMKYTTSNSSSASASSRYSLDMPIITLRETQSGSEMERPRRRQTLGVKTGWMSLDGETSMRGTGTVTAVTTAGHKGAAAAAVRALGVGGEMGPAYEYGGEEGEEEDSLQQRQLQLQRWELNEDADARGSRIKYGVTTVDNLCSDLLNWKSLHLASRMHKPVRIIKDDTRVQLTQQVNLTSAVRGAPDAPVQVPGGRAVQAHCVRCADGGG
ncbi:hypothetical protein H0H92_006945 [Tricholoma furcatifolium]|nr:hypothetical protein H0H92_006945 [Tricholoma furcatifolium]